LDPILLPAHNPGPMTGSGNNTYLIASRGQAVLIDAGVGDHRHVADLATALGDLDARLACVAVTHGHSDHAAGASALASAHPSSAFAKYPWPGEDEQYGVRWQPIDEGDTIDVGDESLLVLRTPGHSPDHVAFWHEAGAALFAGDLLVAGSSVMIHASRGGDLTDYLASLERLLVLSPRVLYPAHGPRIDDPASVITAYLAHRRMRERQIVDALRAGSETVDAIAAAIYDGFAPALMPAARENVRAHLEKLHRDGVAAGRDGRWQLS
jgi:glyoxylase-like metal-dependent hydrolase (beta-lactamase superfamily II)